jgi:hypothetical protein
MQSEPNHLKLNNNFLLFSLSAIAIIIHLYTNFIGGYGIFRDEYYYLACATRLDIGYVDQPPVSIFILAIIKFFLGTSVFAIRLLPALVAGYLVFMTGLITIKLGGRKWAIIISGIITALTPQFIGYLSIYSMNSISLALWVTSFYYVLLINNESKKKYWITLGILMGVGLLNKIDFLWFGAGLFAGLIFTKNRILLKTKEPYIAAAIAFIIFLPFIIWNFMNNFAHIEFMQNAMRYKYNSWNQIEFIKNLILIMNPFSLFLWVPGIFYFFLNKKGKESKILGIIFLTVFLILFINGKNKSEYFTVAFFPVIASGSILFEQFFSKKNPLLTAVKYMYLIVLLVSFIMMTPFGMPALPVETFIKYSAAIGVKPNSSENKRLSELPQFYADMFGWEELAKHVSDVYNNLPEKDRQNTLVLARNYGHAGSLEYYSDKYKLPKIACFHNNYWIWANRELKDNYDVIIVIGGTKEEHLKSCEEVYLAGTHYAKYAMPYENNLPIFVCKKLKVPVGSILKANKNYI